jgi:hypothetical protein
MPAADPAEDARLKAARDAYTAAGNALGHAELAAAARIVRAVMNGAQLLVDKDVNDDDRTTIELLVVFNREGQPLWHSESDKHDTWNYPGMEEVTDDRGRSLVRLDHRVITAIETHLVDAYDAFGGCDGALHTHWDDHFGSDANVLVLDVGEALAV